MHQQIPHAPTGRGSRWKNLSPLAGLALLMAAPSFVQAQALSAGPLLNDLAPLSDEFSNAAALADWSRVNEVEGWNADQLELLDINATVPGSMVQMPYTCSWYQNWRGPMVFKAVTGDFVITTSVTVSARDGVSVPSSDYSLGGIMIRTPRDVTPATWTPGGENFVFLSLGQGNPGVGSDFEFEHKTTFNSNSNLILTPANGNQALLQIARIGDAVLLLRYQPGDAWVVQRRVSRPDMPATLQVGLVSYTDWPKCSIFAPFDHNANVLDPPLAIADPNPAVPYNPDLIAVYDYARFVRPSVPPALLGLDLTDPGQVSDAELIAFLGENTNIPADGGAEIPRDFVGAKAATRR